MENFQHVKKVANGGHLYYYHRPSGQRLPGDYGSDEFVARLGDLNKQFGKEVSKSNGANGALKIYFVQSGRAVKIGKTDGPVHHRIRDLQVGNPVRLKLLGWCIAEETLENQLHSKYRKLRIHGEWFKLSPLLKEEIKRLDAARRRPSERSAARNPAQSIFSDIDTQEKG